MTFKEEIMPWIRGADRYQQNLESHLEYAGNEIVKLHEERVKAVREALKDIIRFCEQFELSENKKETLNEYKKLIEP